VVKHSLHDVWPVGSRLGVLKHSCGFYLWLWHQLRFLPAAPWLRVSSCSWPYVMIVWRSTAWPSFMIIAGCIDPLVDEGHGSSRADQVWPHQACWCSWSLGEAVGHAGCTREGWDGGNMVVCGAGKYGYRQPVGSATWIDWSCARAVGVFNLVVYTRQICAVPWWHMAALYVNRHGAVCKCQTGGGWWWTWDHDCAVVWEQS